MRQNELPQLPELRQEIHHLALMKRSGLSPPVEEFLEHLEALALVSAWSEHITPGIFIKTEYKQRNGERKK